MKLQSKKIALEMAKRTIGGLSEPSKMPWYSYSIPAEYCQTGQKLAKVEGSVCADCYACRGRYLFGVVRNAMDRRFDTIGNPNWVEDFVETLNRLSVGVPEEDLYFRWHDSGDIQSIDHLAHIFQIAERLPHIQFWLPTKEIGYVDSLLKMTDGMMPANLTIRISAAMVDQCNPPLSLGLPVSTVHTEGKLNPQATLCEAYTRGGKCGDCRACWNPSVRWVSYPKH
jgi:hypothetical protein